MPLECKASNSATNSYKRVNHEAASKAETWLQDFGRSQVVPAAVLSGVFKRGQPGGRPGPRPHAALGASPRRPAGLDLAHPGPVSDAIEAGGRPGGNVRP